MESNGNLKEVDVVHQKIFIGIDPGKNGGVAVINEMDDDNALRDKEEAKESLNSSIQTVQSKRGRPKIHEKWSRVISLNTDDLKNL